jgi:hypothetical protein
MMEAPRSLCRRLGIEDPRFVEIESKRKVRDRDAGTLREHLFRMKGLRHIQETVFFDQYLDTPDLALLKAGASLRLRYKGGGTVVYLQYKGPGFHKDGLLYRSEFSSDRLAQVVREESHHDIVHFADISIPAILAEHADPAMAGAMARHLGKRTLERIRRGVILALYRKDKFKAKRGRAFLEPSLDRIFAFHITPGGVHPLSTFWEYENEVKSRDGDILEKLAQVEALRAFDRRLGKRFSLKAEHLDKYHRCASFFPR